jgi:Fe-S-cluster-containing dehydrogenase component
MCLVAIEGRPKLVPSCCEEVKDGMVVQFERPDAREARKSQLEFLLVNHPLDCPICDQAGECKLQDYYMEHGGYDSKMPRDLKVHKRKVVDLGERIVLDKERCVLCSRCVRFCREVSGSHALQFFTRGVTTEIGTENNQPITGDDYIGNVVDICPVGALTSKDFRFKQRVWFLKSAESVCNSCSTGCNIRVDHKDGVTYRYVPRRNEDVNKSWMCDYGRDSYRRETEDRVPAPMVREGAALREATWEEALDLVASRTQAAGPDAVAIVGSPRQTNETSWITRRYAREVVRTPHFDARVDGSHTKTALLADNLLRRQDPHPNNAGLAALGMIPQGGGPDVGGILDACMAGKVKVLHFLGTEILTHPPRHRARPRRAAQGAVRRPPRAPQRAGARRARARRVRRRGAPRAAGDLRQRARARAAGAARVPARRRRAPGRRRAGAARRAPRDEAARRRRIRAVRCDGEVRACVRRPDRGTASGSTVNRCRAHSPSPSGADMSDTTSNVVYTPIPRPKSRIPLRPEALAPVAPPPPKAGVTPKGAPSSERPSYFLTAMGLIVTIKNFFRSAASRKADPTIQYPRSAASTRRASAASTS